MLNLEFHFFPFLEICPSMAAAQVTLRSKFRGCVLGALVGDCMGGRFDSHAETFAVISSKTEPSSLRNQIPRSGGRFLFPFGVDSLMMFTTGDLMVDSVRSGASLETCMSRAVVLAKLQTVLSSESVESSIVKWGTGTRQVLEGDSDRSLHSNCGVTRSLISGLWDPVLASEICAATHTGAVSGAATISRAVYGSVFSNKPISPSNGSDGQYFSLIAKSIDLATKSGEYNESEEFSMHLQNRFAAQFGSDASARCCVAAAVFGVHRTIHSLPHLDANSKAYQARILEVSEAGRARQNKGVSLNMLGNSNRLDAAALYSRLTPSIEQDLPVALAVNWAISLGGDCRSNAFTAGALAGSIWGEEAIPEEWRMFSQGAQRAKDLADKIYDQYIASL